MEAKHPELVREVLRAARRHGVMVFSVAEVSVDRALARHFTQAAACGDLPVPQLYEVQAVRELEQVAKAQRDGSALAMLQGQLVLVRPAHVYGADSALVQASTVLAQGACVCTAEGLLAAQLPVPERGA